MSNGSQDRATSGSSKSGTPSVRINPIVRFAVDRRVTMGMIVLGILVLGGLSLARLPLEFLPTFSSSHISVWAPYRSASPVETERLIVRPLEDILGTINGIDTLSANASADSGDVRLRFVDGTNMDLAAVEVRDRIDRVRHLLPRDLERVYVRRFQTSDIPVLRFNLSADWPIERLYHFAEDVVQRRLERLEGVANVDLRGVSTRELQINLIPSRVTAHGLSARDLISALRDNNVTVSAGPIREGTQKHLVRVAGRFQSLDEIRRLPIGRSGLVLGDVAEVALAFPKEDHWHFLNGHESISIAINKASTANLVQVVDSVRAEMDRIRALPEARGLGVRFFHDTAEDVREGLAQLRQTGLFGGLLAIAFMFLFLRRLRTTLLIALAIPISIVVTFVIMYLARQAGWADLTINVMTLTGLMLAVGMLVDSSIVVIESIFRHHEDLGEDARTASLVGASEVALPIAASTLTTICVFLPMVFLGRGGRFGIFIKNSGLTIIIVMVASLFVALTVVPLVSARLLRGETPRRSERFNKCLGLYARALRFTMRHRFAFMLSLIVLIVLSIFLYTSIGRSFSPPSFERQIRIQVDTSRTYSLEQKRALYDEIYRLLDAHKKELDIVDITHSFRRGSGRSRGWSRANRFELYLTDEKKARLDTDVIRDRIEALLPKRPGVSFVVARSRRGRGGDGSEVEFELRGERMEMLARLSRRIVAELSRLPLLRSVDSSLESGDDEVHVLPDRTRVSQAGLTSQAVAASVSSALSSRAVSYFDTGEQEIDVVVRYREEDRQTLEQLQNLPVRATGSDLPIGAFAQFRRAAGARTIERDNRRPIVRFTAETAGGMPSFVAMRAVGERLDAVDLPPGYELTLGEEARQDAEDARNAVFLLLFALILVYMVMAVLFESFAQPFTIMFSVPFAFVGVGIVMRLAGQSRGTTSDMGFVILAGIVVNNAIVLVDHIGRLRRQGLPRDEAICLGGQHRLRPILMTAATTILGLAPMVAPFFLPQIFGALEGRAAFWAPIGLVILGGLTTSTLLTVMVIPTIYSLVDDLTVFLRRVISANWTAGASSASRRPS